MMKDITKEAISLFVANNPILLKATQAKLCVPVINRMYRKMKAGIYFSPVKTDGNLLCDGHHRYIASLLSGNVIETVPSLAPPSVAVISWLDIVLETEEWDTQAKIDMLNAEDALFNGIALPGLLTLLR